MEAKIEENIFMARLSEQNERYNDMVDFLKIVMEEKGLDMSVDERNLLGVAFKCVVASHRTTWRTIVSVETNPKYLLFSQSITEFRKKIEAGLSKQCTVIIDNVTRLCLKKDNGTDESKAFFLKIVADNYRYIAEMTEGDKKVKAQTAAIANYEAANAVDLPQSGVMKLSINLNWSVFQYEVMNDMAKAIQIAELALASALERIDDLEEGEFKEAKAIIEQLKENVSSWKEDDDAQRRPIDEIGD